MKLNNLNENIFLNVGTLIPTKELIKYYFENYRNRKRQNTILIELFSNKRINKEDIHAQTQFLWYYKNNPFLLDDTVKSVLFSRIKHSITCALSTFEHKIYGLLFILRMHYQTLPEKILHHFQKQELPYFIHGVVSKKSYQTTFNLNKTIQTNISSETRLHKIISQLAELEEIDPDWHKAPSMCTWEMIHPIGRVPTLSERMSQVISEVKHKAQIIFEARQNIPIISKTSYAELVNDINSQAALLLPEHINILFQYSSFDDILGRSVLGIDVLIKAGSNVSQELITLLMPGVLTQIMRSTWRDHNISWGHTHDTYKFINHCLSKIHPDAQKELRYLLLKVFNQYQYDKVLYICQTAVYTEMQKTMALFSIIDIDDLIASFNSNIIKHHISDITERRDSDIIELCDSKPINNPLTRAEINLFWLKGYAPQLNDSQVEKLHSPVMSYMQAIPERSGFNYSDVKTAIGRYTDIFLIIYPKLSVKQLSEQFNLLFQFEVINFASHRSRFEEEILFSNVFNKITPNQRIELAKKIHLLSTEKHALSAAAFKWYNNYYCRSLLKNEELPVLDYQNVRVVGSNFTQEDMNNILFKICVLWNNVERIEKELSANESIKLSR